MTQQPDPPAHAAAMESLCEQGQRQLMAMEYLSAEKTLVQAEQIAWETRDLDTLARLYMPLQECRRQRRQRCAEGDVCLHLIANDADQKLDPIKIIDRYPQGQLLIAGWMSLEPALRVRQLAQERNLYLETFLAAAFPAQGGAEKIVLIVPLADVKVDVIQPPAQSIVISRDELPRGAAGAAELWQRLHLPFLAAADMQVDPLQKIEAYRKTIGVDYACELAHQKLADTARALTIRPHARQA